MAACSVPATKTRLLELFAAQPGLAGVTLSWGAPEGNNYEREHVVVGDAEASRQWANVRPPTEALEETFVVAVEVVATKLEKVQSIAENRAFEIVDQIEQTIRPDPSLGGLIRFCFVRRLRQNNEPVPSGTTAHVFLQVECRARI